MARDDMSDFERQWVQKFISGVRLSAGEETAERVTSIMDPFGYGNADDVVRTTRLAVLELESSLDERAVHDIMTGCACRYPEENLTELKALYDETGDLVSVHSRLQERFLKEIRVYKNLDDEHIDYIVANHMGMAGVIEGDTIVAVKIPKEFRAYYESKDPEEKPCLYCHCPRVRESLKEKGEHVPVSYCLCGAGFYRAIWEYITGKNVRVRILTSVLAGDEVCTIEISFSRT